MHCYADCAVKGSCEPKLFLAVQLPAKLRVYTLVVSPFVGCPVPLKVAFWVPARIDLVQQPALLVCILAQLHSPVTQSYARTRDLIQHLLGFGKSVPGHVQLFLQDLC